MKILNYILIVLILFLFYNNLLAINNPIETAGKNSGLPGEFSTELGFNARNLGMGKTGVGDSYDSSAIYYNPAGLGFLNYAEFSAMYSLLYLTGKYFAIGYVHPFSKNDTVGVGVNGIFVGDIERFDDFGFISGSSYSYNDTCFAIGYSRRMNKKICVGVNLKIASQIFDTKNDFGLGLDMGIMMKLLKNLQWGLVIQNIVGPTLKLETKEEKYPFNAKLGTAINLLK